MTGISDPASASEATQRRSQAEQALGTLTRALRAEYPSLRIRMIPDRRIDGASGADILLQVDEYEMRLLFRDAPTGRPTLAIEHLMACQRLLEENPGSMALILVWTTDGLPAAPLSTSRIRYLIQKPEQLDLLLTRTRPLNDLLSTILAQQTRTWDISFDTSTAPAAHALDIRQLFESAISEAISAERQRSYRSNDRKQAARYFPIEDEQRLILSVLDHALRDVPAVELLPLLTHIPRRGEP